MTKLVNICTFVLAVFGAVTFFLMATVIIAPSSVAAQETVQSVPVCDQRATIIESLSEDYQETRSSIGLANSGSVVEVFSAIDGSWSLIVTRPDGIACLVAAGKNWESLTRKIGQKI